MPDSYEFVRQLMHREAGIVVDAGKEYLIDARLSALARAEQAASVDALIQAARRSTARELQRSIVDAMTIGETTFFRDAEPFEVLRTAVLPALIAARSDVRRLRIWSAACATGQEPYSIAMLIDDGFPELAGWEIEHLATDISRPALARAAAGRYSQLEVNRGLPVRLLIKYFEKRGLEYTLAERIRRTVTFRELNLHSVWPAMGRFDLVFLRNVMIYFDVDTKRRVVARVREHLREDGALFLGGAETTLNLDDRLERVEAHRFGFYRPKSAVSLV